MVKEEKGCEMDEIEKRFCEACKTHRRVVVAEVNFYDDTNDNDNVSYQWYDWLTVDK